MSSETSPSFDHIRRILTQDRIWSAYAIMDLQPVFAPLCHWGVGESADGEGVALLFTGLKPDIVVTVGAAEAVRQALGKLPLPEEIFISARLEHYPALAEWYDFPEEAYQMQRMKFVDTSKVALPQMSNLRRLGLADSDGLKALYAHGGEFAPTFFDPYQLQDGVYFGIHNDAGELVAAGGTHIVDRQEKIAAIGNMYTRADQRGNGYASTIFQAVAATLLADGFADIFLNVDIDNHNAHRIYLRYGFVDYCRYLEGTGVKK